MLQGVLPFSAVLGSLSDLRVLSLFRLGFLGLRPSLPLQSRPAKTSSGTGDRTRCPIASALNARLDESMAQGRSS